MIISKEGLDLVKHFEGCFLSAYLDPVGIPTIAYGRIDYPDGRRVQMGDTCTQEEADRWLLEDLEDEGAKYVRAWIKRPLKQYEWDALVSFTYNRGAGRFRERLVKLINDGKMLQAADCLLEYDWAINSKTKKKTVLAGLTRRRKAERELFLGRVWEKYKS